MGLIYNKFQYKTYLHSVVSTLYFVSLTLPQMRPLGILDCLEENDGFFLLNSNFLALSSYVHDSYTIH